MKYKEIILQSFVCEECEKEVGNLDGFPYYTDKDGNYYCPDCALKNNLCTAEDWLNDHGIRIYESASYKNGKITAFQKWGKGYRKDVVTIA